MFAIDHKTEHYLRSIIGLDPLYREQVKYQELVEGWNIKNLGRPDGQSRMESAISTYENMMVEGSAAPAVILRTTPQGLEVLDGAQRLTANENTGSTHFAAYVIRCSDETARKIRRAANLRLNTAAPVDAAWVLKELIDEFMVHGSDSARDISEITGRKVGDIEKIYKRRLAVSWVSAACNAVDGSAGPELKEQVYDAIAEVARPDDFVGDHTRVVVKFINQLHSCKFRNGDAMHHAGKFFGIKRVGSKNRATQFRTKHRQFVDDPIVRPRLAGSRTQTGIEAIDTKIKALLTVCRNYKKDRVGELDNVDLVGRWDETVNEARRILRECCATNVRHKLDPFA